MRTICASTDLADGGAGVRFEVSGGKFGAANAPAFAVRFRGEVHAFFNRCGHVPVELDLVPGQFFDFTGLYLICTTHGALYDPMSGRCVGGRCDGRGLTPLAVTEREGWVYLLEG